MTVIKAGAVTRLSRGGGVVTIPLITRQTAEEENKITTGISVYPPGTGAPLHLHNCDEHVTLLRELEFRKREAKPDPALRGVGKVEGNEPGEPWRPFGSTTRWATARATGSTTTQVTSPQPGLCQSNGEPFMAAR